MLKKSWSFHQHAHNSCLKNNMEQDLKNYSINNKISLLVTYPAETQLPFFSLSICVLEGLLVPWIATLFSHPPYPPSVSGAHFSTLLVWLALFSGWMGPTILDWQWKHSIGARQPSHIPNVHCEKNRPQMCCSFSPNPRMRDVWKELTWSSSDPRPGTQPSRAQGSGRAKATHPHPATVLWIRNTPLGAEGH